MKSLLSVKAIPPTSVLKLAQSVSMTHPVSVLELMRRLGSAARERPFYIIAHACNDVDKVKWAVGEGANAIECDIDLPIMPAEIPAWEFVVRHFPTPVGVPIKLFLDGLVEVLKQNPNVALVYFDLKSAHINLARLREIIHQRLTFIVPVQIILSHAAWDGRKLFNPIKNDTAGEGLLIDEDDDPNRVSHFFSEEKRLVRFGYGNGVAAPGVALNIPASIMQGVAIKWSTGGKIRFVVTYTLAAQDSMRDYIAKGVDGIMVNDIAALKSVFNKTSTMYRLRLAERSDDPFALPVHPSYVLTVLTTDEFGGGTDANLTFELRGSAGKISAHIDAFPAGLFEAGQTNYVTLIGKDVGTIKELSLYQDGVGEWSVSHVMVRKRGSTDVVMFNFNQVIPPDKAVVRKPG